MLSNSIWPSIASLATNAWHFLVFHAATIGIVSGIITILSAIWWGRRILVWLFGWLRSAWEESRPEARQLPHPLRVGTGDRRSTLWQNERRVANMLFVVYIALHITNLEVHDLQISQALLRYRRGWWPISMLKEGDLSLSELVEPRQILNQVIPGKRMVHGRGSWTFQNPLAREPNVLAGRVCIVDGLGRRSWSKKIKIPCANDESRAL